MISHTEKILLTQQELQERVALLAAEITRDYENKELTILALMKGSVVFLADLLRLIPIPLKLEVLPVASYHSGTKSSGVVTFKKEFLPKVTGEHVLIVDDILDSGTTLKVITNCLLEQNPASLRACVLLHKRAKSSAPESVRYIGFEIPDEFVVGYGLDYQEYYRNLPDIRTLSAATIARRSTERLEAKG